MPKTRTKKPIKRKRGKGNVHLAPYIKAELLQSIADRRHTITSAAKWYGVSTQSIYAWTKAQGIVYEKYEGLKGNTNGIKSKI